jgi:hypothetical protein
MSPTHKLFSARTLSPSLTTSHSMILEYPLPQFHLIIDIPHCSYYCLPHTTSLSLYIIPTTSHNLLFVNIPYNSHPQPPSKKQQTHM